MFLDSIQRFRDTLNVMVMESKDVAVPLEVNGIGSTVVCTDRSLTDCAFGVQFTARPFEQELVLMNMGRETQTVVWINSKAVDQAQRAKKAKQLGKCYRLNPQP